MPDMRRLFGIALLAALPVFSQSDAVTSTAPEEGSRNRTAFDPPIVEPAKDHVANPVEMPGSKRWYNIPLPLVGTSSLPPQTPGQLVEPLTPKQKLHAAINRTVGPAALANRALLAGLNQYRNKPEEWGQGWDAYGQRFGYRMARLAARNAIMLGFDVAMKTDQRYDRCACSGVLGRTGHAFRRVVLARTDSGGETVNLARIAGAYGGLAVAYQLYPERYRTADHILNAGSQYLLWRGVSNIVREFWPEIHRIIRIGPRPTSRTDID